MKQYTTPTERLLLEADVSSGFDVWVYLKSAETVVEKTTSNNDLTITPTNEGCEIQFVLDQTETKNLAKYMQIEIEVTWKETATGYVGKSETAYIRGIEALKKEVV